MRNTPLLLLAAILLAPSLPAANRTEPAEPDYGGTLRFAFRSDPKNLDPYRVETDTAGMVRYLTGGVLIRQNRKTQKLEGHLAESWKLSEQGRLIRFKLRDGVKFSDGSAVTAADVAASLERLFDPAMKSSTADMFRGASGKPVVERVAARELSIRFPAPVAGVEAMFDLVPVMPARLIGGGKDYVPTVTAGPFTLKEHKSGQYVELVRNRHYWRRDRKGRALPYLDAIRIDIQANREIELMRFRRGELDLIPSVDAATFDRLEKADTELVQDGGPTFDSEFLWFNLRPGSPLPAHKQAWFASPEFRAAVSAAIRRDDICKVIFRGRALPASGPVSPSNLVWFNKSLKPLQYDAREVAKRLQKAGFQYQGKALHDSAGRPVEFSIVTTATRERMAAMVQQDLAAIGIGVNLVKLDMPSLIERIVKTFAYEAAMLGFVNVAMDPSGQMNIWPSSATSHAWNPNQKTPASPWEAEIDKLMRAQASTADTGARRKAFDRVQEIVRAEQPFIYLVHRNALAAVAKHVHNASVVSLFPQALWNVEETWIGAR